VPAVTQDFGDALQFGVRFVLDESVEQHTPQTRILGLEFYQATNASGWRAGGGASTRTGLRRGSAGLEFLFPRKQTACAAAVAFGGLVNRHRRQIGDCRALLFFGESVPGFRFCHFDALLSN
jgi:hypothetical protein